MADIHKKTYKLDRDLIFNLDLTLTKFNNPQIYAD